MKARRCARFPASGPGKRPTRSGRRSRATTTRSLVQTGQNTLLQPCPVVGRYSAGFRQRLEDLGKSCVEVRRRGPGERGRECGRVARAMHIVERKPVSRPCIAAGGSDASDLGVAARGPGELADQLGRRDHFRIGDIERTKSRRGAPQPCAYGHAKVVLVHELAPRIPRNPAQARAGRRVSGGRTRSPGRDCCWVRRYRAAARPWQQRSRLQHRHARPRSCRARSPTMPTRRPRAQPRSGAGGHCRRRPQRWRSPLRSRRARPALPPGIRLAAGCSNWCRPPHRTAGPRSAAINADGSFRLAVSWAVPATGRDPRFRSDRRCPSARSARTMAWPTKPDPPMTSMFIPTGALQCGSGPWRRLHPGNA